MEILEKVNGMVWGIPTLLLIFAAGIYISILTGFVQVRQFPRAIKLFFSSLMPGANASGKSSFQALCTALAATVGTGNLAGVAGAIALGGPGAVFWMWVGAFFGMATKYAEATLAVLYRKKMNDGGYAGGPMYMIRLAMGERWLPLAKLYAFFGVVAAFGVGNATQINTVIAGLNNAQLALGIEPTKRMNLVIALVLALLVMLMVAGGAKRIGAIAQWLVPFASAAYILLGFVAMGLRCNRIPGAFSAIFRGAFSPQAVTGGMIGTVLRSMRVGISRGVFTNEAGLGTASIAHAGADVRDPAHQGLMGIVEVFLDTIVICTVTALVILTSGIPVPYGKDVGINLTSGAFRVVFGQWVDMFVALSLCAFAFATVLGWGLYGIRCAQFLFSQDVSKYFVLLQGITVVAAAVLETGTVWLLCEIVNALMAIPNLICLLKLAPGLKMYPRRK